MKESVAGLVYSLVYRTTKAYKHDSNQYSNEAKVRRIRLLLLASTFDSRCRSYVQYVRKTHTNE